MATPIDREEVLYQLERLRLEALLNDECEEETIKRCISTVKLVPTFAPPNEWVSVEEKLPPPKQNVLAYSTRSGIAEADYADGVWMQYRWSAVMESVTHWMPLPVPPVMVDES